MLLRLRKDHAKVAKCRSRRGIAPAEIIVARLLQICIKRQPRDTRIQVVPAWFDDTGEDNIDDYVTTSGRGVSGDGFSAGDRRWFRHHG
jgi:hypothetical protein